MGVCVCVCLVVYLRKFIFKATSFAKSDILHHFTLSRIPVYQPHDFYFYLLHITHTITLIFIFMDRERIGEVGITVGSLVTHSKF